MKGLKDLNDSQIKIIEDAIRRLYYVEKEWLSVESSLTYDDLRVARMSVCSYLMTYLECSSLSKEKGEIKNEV